MVLSNEIRILDLLPHPGDDNAPIKCEIRVAALASKPKYEAVSYVWGDEASLVDIELSGQRVGVTKNLHAALQRLRLQNEKRPLWIDQLCINQWDTKEKTEQVRLMRDIYSNCFSCALWLGEIRKDIPVADAKAGMAFMRYLAKVEESKNADSVPTPPMMESLAPFQAAVRALEAMTRGNPWWARVWTVQEAALPPHLVLMWGPLSMPWEMMIQATRTWLRELPLSVRVLLAEPHLSMLQAVMALVIWLRIAKDAIDGPMDMVHRWRFRKATDPRDKIYALFGLCHPGSLPAVELCSYDMPTVEVFCSLTIDLLLNEEGLRPLIADPRLEEARATPGMPRWALDIADICKHNTDWYHLFGYRFYNANAGRQANLGELRTRAQQDHRTLELRGVLVDTIERVGERLYKPVVNGPSAYQRYTKAIRGWEALAQEWVKRGTSGSSELYPGGYTLREAFGRLILGNLIRDHNQQPTKSADGEDVESVYRFLDTARPDIQYMTIWGMVKNQTFFVTKTGLIGIGHLDTQPGDEVWVFYGGRVPFTVTPKKDGGADDYDFGGRCYVQGVMNGEMFEGEEPPKRTIRIH